MKTIIMISVLFLVSCASTTFRDQDTKIETVAIEVEPYLGLWYEIARFPNWFEKDCEEVTAQYVERGDKKISVINSCMKNGVRDVAKGVARVEGEGKLGVSFTPWLPGLWGDYWVLGRREYEIAVIGNPKGSTGWILARNPSISAEDRAWAEKVLIENGYDVSRLENVKQSKSQRIGER